MNPPNTIPGHREDVETSVPHPASRRRGGTAAFHTLSAEYISWLRSKGQSPATLKLAATAFLTFRRLVRVDDDVRAVRREDVETFARAALDRYARESARHFIWRMKHFFRWLARRGRILIDPAASLPIPRKEKRLLGPTPTINEVEQLLAALDTSNPCELRDRAALEVLYGSGLRIGEMRKLALEDVNFERREIHVRGGKFAKDRIVPMTSTATLWLGRYLAEIRPNFLSAASGDRVFIDSQGGRPISDVGFQQRLRKLARRAGIARRITPHAFRRAFASHLLASGAPAMIVMELLGHSGVRTLERYLAVAPVDLTRTMERTHPRP